MSRNDEVREMAAALAVLVCNDPADRERVAAGLITLAKLIAQYACEDQQYRTGYVDSGNLGNPRPAKLSNFNRQM